MTFSINSQHETEPGAVVEYPLAESNSGEKEFIVTPLPQGQSRGVEGVAGV